MLRFNQPMDTTSAIMPLRVQPEVEARWVWDEEQTTLTFAPVGGFSPGRRYTVVVDKNLTADSGHTFVQLPEWRVEVVTRPRVTNRSTRSENPYDRYPTFALVFSRAMDRASVEAAVRVEPAIPLELVWEEAKLLVQIADPLPPDTRYDFTLEPTAADEQGVPLTNAYTWSYTSVKVVNGVTAPRDRQSPFSIRFNYAMDPESVAGALVVEPAIEGVISWNDSQTICTFIPAAPLPNDVDYLIRFERELFDANGDPLAAPEPVGFTSPPPIIGRTPLGPGVHPATSVRVTFDRPMDETVTAAAFQLSPPVTGTVTWEETTLVFAPGIGYLAEETEYTVSISPAARGAEGEAILDEPFSWTFHTSHLSDLADFGSGPNAQVVDVNGRRAVQFQLFQREPAAITFELYRLTLAQFLDRYASGFRGAAGWEENRPISTEGTPRVRRWTVETVERPRDYGNVQEVLIPADVPPGLYLLNLKAGHVNDQLILLLSQNTLTIKQAEGQLVVWVTDINGGPVPGIEVSVYARDNVLLASGRADEYGIFRTEVGVDPQPLIVIAADREDVTASGLSNEWLSRSAQWWGWWRPAPVAQDYAVYVYTDRPIYRPGQLIFYKAILRQDDDAILDILPAGAPVTVRIRDARNNVVQTFEDTTNHFGTVNGQFQLAEGAMLGEYAVEVVVGDSESHRQIFKVEEYRKPDYRVTVTTDSGRYVSGENVQVMVDTSYFFGEPVANAGIEARLYYLGERSWWDERSQDQYVWYKTYQPPRTGRTGADGRFTFTLPAEFGYSNLVSRYWSYPVREAIWAIEATVDDGSHQTVSGFAVIRVYEASEVIQVDKGGYLHEPGQPFTVRAQVHTIFDEPVSGRQLTLSLRRWDTGRGDYLTTVQTAGLTTGADGRASLSFTIEEAGFYQLRVSGRDAGGREMSYTSYVLAYGRQYQSWYGRAGGLYIEADRERYAPGDTAHLLIESAFSGPALLTFERGTTRREQLIELTAPVTLVEVAIQPGDAPNIYVTVNAWQEQDTTVTEDTWESLPDSRLRTATVNLPVPVTNKTLNVTITPNQAIYAPRQEATFTVRVTNQQGTPVSAELSLAMVDEAMFALSEELSGPIFDAFYHERPRLVRTYDALALIRYLGGGYGGGGGGDELGGPRSDFPDTAVWFPVLHTDANGEATVTVTLPDSLTSWRLTAKAVTADTQVGETFINVLTQQEIVVRPILPSTLTAGDQVYLSAFIHNYSEAAQTVEVSIKIGNPGNSGNSVPSVPSVPGQLVFTDPVTQTIQLPPGTVQVVGWTATAASAGDAQIVVRAEVGGVTQDAVQLSLAIRPLAVPDVTTQVGDFTSVLNTTVDVPAGTLPMSSVRLELSRSIAGTLLQGLEYLTGYPYGCVEQTMSRALPNAVVGRALFQLGVTHPTLQADLPAMINASLQRLYGYQHNDGGWGWWYDDSSHDYQTAWVIFGLTVIADAGYEVDPNVIERGVAWLNENLGSMDIRTRAYALYSMALARAPNLAETQGLAGQLETLDTFSRAALALTLYEAGDTAGARAIVDYLAETAVMESDGQVHWPGDRYDGNYHHKTMSTATRSTALALSAFAEIRPGHALQEGIVRWLMAQRQPQGWGSTNETSYAILGLTDHLLATSFSESATDSSYTVYLNGDVFTSGRLGRGEPAVSLEIPADRLQPDQNNLRITHSGTGRLYYVLNSRVYLAQNEIEAAGVVEVSRVYLDPGTNRPVEAVTAGQLVKVRLTVDLPEAASFIIVEDSLPGGLEALNESLNTSSHEAVAYEEPRYDWQAYGYNQKEIRPGRVAFFITEMDSQPRTFTYYARATHTGAFVAMPVEVYAMYDLTTWGRSASSQLIVQ
ncbi:MAG: Ig-like domain-containing protein [Chloroflexota bacterium]